MSAFGVTTNQRAPSHPQSRDQMATLCGIKAEPAQL